MADHGDNYVRLMGDECEEIGVLGPDCGHHCGALIVGHARQMIRHCDCRQCHHIIKNATIMSISIDANERKLK